MNLQSDKFFGEGRKKNRFSTLVASDKELLSASDSFLSKEGIDPEINVNIVT